MQSRSWEQDGQKRSKVEVLANDVTFLDSRGGQEGGGQAGGGGEFDQSAPSGPAPSKSGAPKKSNKKADVVIEDIGDEPINLDDIPF